MKMLTILKRSLCIVILLLTLIAVKAQNASHQRTVPFNKGWYFKKNSQKFGPKIANADVTGWQKLNLPHDWSLDDLPEQTPDTIQGPFSRFSVGTAATGWTVGGTAWYKNKFVTESQWKNKLVSIHFDGVYMNSEVYLNGYFLGRHPYGYTPFFYDLTPYLNSTGQENILAVRVENEGKNSRWYSGSGIYREVELNVTNPLHVDTWGVHIKTPEVSKESASILINTTINNKLSSSKAIKLTTRIIAPNGKEVSKSENELELGSYSKKITAQDITLSSPELWSVESPEMYAAVTEVSVDNKVVDAVTTPFGIRSIEFHGSTGFKLNGKNILLKGGCIHHDNGPLGAESFARAEERKVKILKDNGYNAIRYSHQPPSRHFLNACDRLGMLVVEEAFDTWFRPKKPNDYNLYFNEWWQKDLEAMILRDRNHPSVIIWSIGNEIYETPDPRGVEMAEKMVKEVYRLDGTRPTTAAQNYLPGYTKEPWEKFEKHTAHLDIDMYNYFLDYNSPFYLRDSATINRYDTEHQKHPEKTFAVSEFLPYYALDNWNKVEEKPYVIGAFKWVAYDYLGEAGMGLSRLQKAKRPDLKGLIAIGLFYKDEWPIFQAYAGDYDLIGNKKTAGYYQDVIWRQSPVEMLVHEPIPEGYKEKIATWGFPEEWKSWNWPGMEGKEMLVTVYTRSEKVQLELNGKVIAEKEVPAESITVTFDVKYQPGTLVAKSFIGNVETGSDTIKSAGKPYALRLTAERGTVKADISELSYINVEVVDKDGNVVPNVSDLEVKYDLKGDVSLAAVGNGNPRDASSFQQPHKKVFRGRGQIIVRPNGESGTFMVTATAKGLKSANVQVFME